MNLNLQDMSNSDHDDDDISQEMEVGHAVLQTSD